MLLLSCVSPASCARFSAFVFHAWRIRREHGAWLVPRAYLCMAPGDFRRGFGVRLMGLEIVLLSGWHYYE